MGKAESDIQGLIKKAYKKRGWKVLKIDPRSGTDSGLPDLLCVGPGATVLFIEVKKPGKSLKPIQAYQRRELRALGHEVIVADNMTVACAPLHREDKKR